MSNYTIKDVVKKIFTLINKRFGNVENKSSETIRREITKDNVTTALGYTPYTPTEVDNKFSTLETNIDWKESVDTFDDIATTYPNPIDGWTVNVKDTDYTYRYNGTKWVTISANAIPKATNDIDGLLSKEDHAKYDDTNSKKHTHSNKSVIDGISSTNVSNWNSAKEHADSEHAPSDAQANVIETVKVNGTVLIPESKAVDIIVPTKVSELENDKNYLSSVPDEYVTNAELEVKGYLTEHQDISGKMDTSLKGAPNGVAELDTAGKVPSSQLPSYVIEGYLYNSKFYTDSAYTTEITGESGKIYIDLLSEKTYRWSGNTFAVVSETLALGETSSTAYRGDRGKVAYDHSQTVHAPSDAEVNQNAFSTIIVDSTTIAADSKTATLILVAGDNVTITSDATNNKITISFNGKADIATKAIQDGNGNVITSTYANVSHTHKYAGSFSAGGAAYEATKLEYEVVFKGTATSDISTTLTSQDCEFYNYVGISGAINGYKFTQFFPMSTFYEYGDNAKGCCIAIANGLSSSTLTGMVRFNDHDHIIELINITLYEVVLFKKAFGTMNYFD